MKAEINAEGRMTIRPETELEHYALTKWWQDWMDRQLPVKTFRSVYVHSANDKLRVLPSNGILIDDCPRFESFEQVALVERPYNKHVTDCVKEYDR